MKLDKALKLLKENKKIRHKTWDSLIIEELTGKIIVASDNRGYIYYFQIEDFKERFGKLKENWKIVDEKEYANHTDPLKCSERVKSFVPSNLREKNFSESLEENIVWD